MLILAIDHFTVLSLVAWPLNESEAGGDLALIETSLLFYVNDAVLMLISGNLHNKRSEVSIITRSPPASLSFKGRVTRHTTVKRSIVILVSGKRDSKSWYQWYYTV